MDIRGTPHLLVVEDEDLFLDMLQETLTENGYVVHVARTGEEARAVLQSKAALLDAILLDRLLPDMDSLVLVPEIKSNPVLARVPVIIQTSLTQDDEVQAGLRAGAYYYLTKPFSPQTLLSIVRAATQDHASYVELQERIDQTRGIMRNLQQGIFRFRTTSEARDLAALVCHAAPDPSRVVLGLTELMLNAVEHGNLGITYAEKSTLIASESLAKEVEQRLADSRYASRHGLLALERTQTQLVFTVSDQGAGFNWQDYLDIAPERAFDTHGRGIAMSRLLSFDRIEYQGCGNRVQCFVDL